MEAIKKPFYRLTYSEAADLLRGARARQLLEQDLAQKKARLTEVDRRIEELDAVAKGGGKQWEKDKAAAEAMMDFVYDVKNAARLAAWIYYISPVKGVAEEIAKTDPDLAANELLFPSAETAKNMYPQPALPDADDIKWSELSADLEGA